MPSFCCKPFPGCLRRLISLVVALSLQSGLASAAALLPDLFSWESEPLGYMHGGTFDLDSEPGRVLYRFNTAIPNQGDGTFEVFEITHPNRVQDVYQNIYESTGGFTTSLMGSFTIDEDPPFGHLHLEGLAKYSLREVTTGNGVGSIVASHLKTSHGLVDSVSYNLSLPGAPPTRVYNSAQSFLLGVSVGWADLYSKTIPKQRIDVTGVPSGQYWLEVVIDPFNIVQETDETNNTTRILVDLTIPDPVFLAADFNEDTYVNSIDLQIWETNFSSTTASHLQGDSDDDQDVDGADFLMWQRQFRSGEGSLPALLAVPEPGTVALLVELAIFSLFARRYCAQRAWGRTVDRGARQPATDRCRPGPAHASLSYPGDDRRKLPAERREKTFL